PRAEWCDLAGGGGGRYTLTRPDSRGPRRTGLMSSTATPSVARPGVAFAGVFAVTFSGLLAVGAVLPVLPRYVHGPLDGGDIAVGIVIGSYAVTGLLLRPFAGRLADQIGRA